jgi:probable F420-dependent oxidoreductase
VVKFGFMAPRESDFDDTEDPYGRIFAMCERAEELGFDFVTFTHHRFSPDRPYLSSPFIMMSAVAARTSRLQLATTVLVLPLYHPLDVAEAVASLDQLSGGRVILGVGAGYREYEAEAVGVPFRQRVGRMTEGIEVLRRAWAPGPATFHGRHFNFDAVDVVPKPHGEAPPIWIGALEATPVQRAGRIGDGWIAPSLQTLDTLAGRAALYRDAAGAAGRPTTICLERDAAVSADRGAAQAGWYARNAEMVRHYRDRGAVMPDVGDGDEGTFAALGRGRAVAGTPDDCIAEIRRCEAAIGCDYLQLMNMGTGPSYGHRGSYATELAGLELFGREVIPAFR